MNRHIPSDKSNFIKNLATKGASQSLTEAMRNFQACGNYVVAEVVSDVYISLHISYKLPFISGIYHRSQQAIVPKSKIFKVTNERTTVVL